MLLNRLATDRYAENQLMIESITIKNFRCFRHLELSGLKRFNVLVGDSASGKTAFLESIFITGAANPEAYLRLRRFRGFGEGIKISGTRVSYESLFRDIFFGLDNEEPATIRFREEMASQFRQLSIRYQRLKEYQLPLKAGIAQSMSIRPIHFEWKTPAHTYDSSIEIKDGSLNMKGFGDVVYPIYYSYAGGSHHDLVAERFSELSKRNATGPVIDAVSRVYPEVQSLSLESLVGELTLYVQVRSMRERLPLAALSGGISKFVSIAISIASNEGGVMLIDEIESGLYYKNMPMLMDGILRLCKEVRVQLFATTHSYEILQSIIPILQAEKWEDDFALLRSHRDPRTGESNIRIAKGLSSASAIEQHEEVR